MTRRLNFGPYVKKGGLDFEEYVQNALTRIEKWSHDVKTRHDTDNVTAFSTLLTLENGSLLLLESGSRLIFE